MSRYPLRTVYIHLVRVFREYREGETFLQTNGRKKKSLKQEVNYFTSAGTLNFSTTPSSKKQRMPHLMSSNSDRGKSLKRNSRNSTVFASGRVDFCRAIRWSKQSTLISWAEAPEVFSRCSPTVCTSPSGHSLQARNQGSPECSICKSKCLTTVIYIVCFCQFKHN